MGQADEENAVPENEAEAEKEKLRPDPPGEDVEMQQKVPIKTKDAAYPEMIPGIDEPFIKSSHLKYLLFGFNFLLTMLGIVLLAISIWVTVDPVFWEYQATLNVDNFSAVCSIFIVASLVVLIVGVLGCMAAATERRWLLILYMTIFGLLFILQLAALILMWVAPYSSKISRELERQLAEQIADRPHDDSARYFIDFIQEHLYCCGSKGVRDYYPEAAPRSCQDPRTGTIFEHGCANKMLLYLRSKAGIVGGLALPVLFLQVLALVATGCLIKNIAGESRYFM